MSDKSRKWDFEYPKDGLEFWQESTKTDRRIMLTSLGIIITNATMIGAGAVLSVEGDIVNGAICVSVGVGAVALSTKIFLNELDEYSKSTSKVSMYQSKIEAQQR